MMNIGRLCAVLAILLWPSLGHSDEVFLVDGSRLQGTVLKIQDGKLTLQTAHVGKLSMAMTSVSGITTDTPRGVSLDNVTARTEQLIYDAQRQHFLGTQEQLGEAVALAEVLLLWPAEEEMPKPARLWSGRVELGINGADGNSQRSSFLGRTNATRKRDQDTLLLYFQGAYAEDNGVRSRNEFKAGGRYEWNFTPKWSAYFRSELEEDEFEALDLRSTAVLGMGYKLLMKPKQSLAARLGLGYLREDFEEADTNQDAIFDFGYDYALQVLDWSKLVHKLTYYSAVDEPTEGFRLVVDTGAEFPLSHTEQWKLRLGITHEYDDEPLPEVKRLDTTYYLNLGYDW